MSTEKRIGIMSMQRVCNYGSFLQAYGLKKIIESFGYSVVFIDYKTGRPVDFKKNKMAYYKLCLRQKTINIASSIYPLLPFLSKEQKYTLAFQHMYKKHFLPKLGIKKYSYHVPVDTLIIGSDEVFNCLQSNPTVGYSTELFGYNHVSNRLISYAASFGNTTYEELVSNGKEEEISNLFSNFNAISVRDENSASVVSRLIGSTPDINIDPVLAYDFSNEEIPNIKESDYIVIYAYRNRLSNEEKKAIQDFAKKEKKTLVCIGGYQDFCDKHILGSPFEILGYIKNADYVITDTFHGTIFSIINHRQFVSFVRNGHGQIYGNYEKLTDLLKRLNLETRVALDTHNFEEKLLKPIDYTKVDEIILSERQKTLNFLKENI